MTEELNLRIPRKNSHHYSKRVGVVDPDGVANLCGLWDWVGMTPRMGPESHSCTFPLGQPVSRKAGKKKSQWQLGQGLNLGPLVFNSRALTTLAMLSLPSREGKKHNIII